jgi:hypothetical protein
MLSQKEVKPVLLLRKQPKLRMFIYIKQVIQGTVQNFVTGHKTYILLVKGPILHRGFLGINYSELMNSLGIFLFTTASRTALGPTQLPIQWVPGALFLGVKGAGRESHHPPPSRAEVKMTGAIPPLPQYVFMAWCLVKHRDTLPSVLHL